MEAQRLNPLEGIAVKARAGALCGVPAAGAGGGGTTSEFLPIAVLLAAFTGAAVWMFRRWGPNGRTEAPEGTTQGAPQPLRAPAVEA